MAKFEVKLTFNEVKNFIEQESKCKLLSTEYSGTKAMLLFECECGEQFCTTFEKFKTRNKRQCNKCGRQKRSDVDRLTLAEVREYVSTNSNCILLSNEYHNYNSPLKFRCECGNEFQTTLGNFRSNNKRHCDECGKIHNSLAKMYKYEDVKNIIESSSDCLLISTEYNGKRDKLIFQCKCGEIFPTTFEEFVRAGKKQCNKCSIEKSADSKRLSFDYVKNYIESNGNNKLMSETYKNNATKLEIQCECSEIYYVSFAKFVDGQRKCGQCSKLYSNGEMAIINILENLGIKYISQYWYSDCKHIIPLKFDFAILNEENQVKILIEYDGIQHFQPIEHFGGTDSFYLTQLRDSIKNKYCLDNNITLVRIPYWDFNNIEQIIERTLH